MSFVEKTGTLTTSTGTVVLPIRDNGCAVIVVSGTYAGVTAVIEGSLDGTTYSSIPARRASSGAGEFGTLTLGTNETRAWYVNTSNLTHIRIRATAYTSGTVNVAMQAVEGSIPSARNGIEWGYRNSGQQTGVVAAGSTGANTVIVATGPGILNQISVTTAGSASAIIYDNATTNSGKILFSTPTVYAIGTITSLNVRFENGITVRKASGTAAMTVSYKLL